MSEPQKEIFEIPQALAGERLDRIVAMMGGYSRSQAAVTIEAGEVKVAGKIHRSGKLKLTAGTKVEFAEAPIELPTAPTADPNVAFEVLYCDEHIAVIDKPAGLVVHPGAGQPDKTLVNGLLYRFPQIAEVGDTSRPGIVHRLDVGTTGVMMVALTQSSYEALVTQLADRHVSRRYIAVLHGAFANERGTIEAPIARSSARRTKMAVDASGREAITHYELLSKRESDPAASLVHFNLETGRTHQIRVHTSAIGHPVVGDYTYGSRRSEIDYNGVALHAQTLKFQHPETADEIEVSAPLPQVFESLCEQLELALPK